MTRAKNEFAVNGSKTSSRVEGTELIETERIVSDGRIMIAESSERERITADGSVGDAATAWKVSEQVEPPCRGHRPRPQDVNDRVMVQ
jgi:hypothetical protein